VTVAAIIQARMGSSRLPGKVLRLLAGKPILWHIIHRLRKSNTIDRIAIATTIESEDDALVEFARAEGIECVRGSEDNVLARFALAADALEADIILRVTGDAPLVDPAVADKLIEVLQKTDGDYATYAPEGIAIDEGFSPFSRRALDRLCAEAPDDPVAREHVTAYFKAHPAMARTVTITPPTSRAFDARISVDTPADLLFLETIYQRLKAEPGEADVEDVVNLLRRNPELLEINQHVHQKAADEQALSVLIRCDGGTEVGMGHMVRCLALADTLRDRHGAAVGFAVGGEEATDAIRGGTYSTELLPEGTTEDLWLRGLVARQNTDILVVDVRSDLQRETLEQIRADGILVVIIDDPSDRRLAADLAFYPPVPQVYDLDWTGLTGTVHTGWQWVVLRSQFAGKRHPKVAHDGAIQILIAMGATDPKSLSLRAMDALEDQNLHVAIGVSAPDLDQLRDRAAESAGRITLHENVEDMAELMSEMDLAIAAFGITAYELAVVGVPAVYLCHNDQDTIAAQALESAGAGMSLGEQSGVDAAMLRAKVLELVGNREGRELMSASGTGLGLGDGVRNVAREIAGAAQRDN
jgi:spore coat polysaccharide biosynthesis protein SpsF